MPAPPPPTAAPASTSVPAAGVHLSEILPAPRGIDWDRNGVANARDEWIELYNGSARRVDIGGWSLDLGRGRSRPYRIPRGTLLQPGAYLILYRQQTNLALDDASGQVRLLDPAGRLVDSANYGALLPDRSLSRDPLGLWRTDWPPSPGAPSVPPASPTATPIMFQ
jgi:hypothetical protein